MGHILENCHVMSTYVAFMEIPMYNHVLSKEIAYVTKKYAETLSILSRRIPPSGI